MISLARANLIYEWRTSLAIISVLALVGTLILVQVGIPFGGLNSWLGPLRDSSADFIAQPKRERRSVAGSDRRGRLFAELGNSRISRFESRHEGLFWMHPNVNAVETGSVYEGGWAEITWADEKSDDVSILVVEAGPVSLKIPKRFDDEIRRVLAVPGNIVISKALARRRGAKLGDEVRSGEQYLRIAGIVRDLWEADGARIMVSRQTARLYQMDTYRSSRFFYLIGLEDKSRARQTREELRQYLGNKGVTLKTPEELVSARMAEYFSMISESSYIFVAIFALVIGFSVTAQVMRSSVLSQLNEFAALRALGAPRAGIAKVIAEQAFWSGIIGIPVTIGTAFAIKNMAQFLGIYIHYPGQIIVISCVLVVVIAVGAGIIALNALYRVDPAELMR